MWVFNQLFLYLCKKTIVMDLRTATYLDPKNDLTFRKIFGEHPHIIKSFLNAVLPFEEDRFIESLCYQDPAMLPELPELKHSVVDVRCKDNYGRQFIVEKEIRQRQQIQWFVSCLWS